MKDIELAEEWAEKEYDELRYEKCERKDFVFTFYELKEMGKQAFLAGLNAKTQWHDLRENPDDLPKENGDYIVCFLDSACERHSFELSFVDCFDGKHWFDKNNPDVDGYDEGVIAWYEIPKFEE